MGQLTITLVIWDGSRSKAHHGQELYISDGHVKLVSRRDDYSSVIAPFSRVISLSLCTPGREEEHAPESNISLQPVSEVDV